MKHNFEEWRDIWKRALANVPRRLRKDHTWMTKKQAKACGAVISPETLTTIDWNTNEKIYLVKAPHPMPSDIGQYVTLGKLLGLPMRRKDGGGSISVHNRIWTNLCRGSVPRDPVVRGRLLKLAGPYGKMIAWLTIKKMGLEKKHAKPEHF